MTKDTLKTIATIEGLLTVGSFLLGLKNPEWWLTAAFYVLLPLFVISFLTGFFSIFLDSTASHHNELKRFVGLHIIALILLGTFIYWASGGFGA